MNVFKRIDVLDKNSNFGKSSFRESNKDRTKETPSIAHLMDSHFETKDKENIDFSTKQRPRILTGRLPSAFDMKVKKHDKMVLLGKDLLPKKVKYEYTPCITEEDSSSSKTLNKSGQISHNMKMNTKLHSAKGTRTPIEGMFSDSEKSDQEFNIFNKPIALKGYNRNKSFSPNHKNSHHEEALPMIKKKPFILNNLLDMKPKFCLEEGFTISQKKFPNYKTKLFFHIPSMKIFSIEEIPINSNYNIIEKRNKLKKLEKLKTVSSFKKITHELFNNPEGFNESLLKNLAKSLLESSIQYTNKIGENFDDFCLCNVFVTKNGTLKIKTINTELYHSQCCASNFNKITQIIKNSTTRTASSTSSLNFDSNEINYTSSFIIGLNIFFSSLGIMEYPVLKRFSVDHLINAKKENECCFLHLLLKMEKQMKTKLKIANKLKSCSEAYLNFLCKILSLNKTYEPQRLQKHVWFEETSDKVLFLEDLMRVEYNEDKLDFYKFKIQFDMLHKNIMKNNHVNLKDYKDEIHELASLFKLCSEFLYEYFEKAIK